jgi:hypothetical protein
MSCLHLNGDFLAVQSSLGTFWWRFARARPRHARARCTPGRAPSQKMHMRRLQTAAGAAAICAIVLHAPVPTPLRSPTTSSGGHARISAIPHTPGTTSSGGHARISAIPHTPGTTSSVGYARIFAIPHTPGTTSSGGHARISAIPHTPGTTSPGGYARISEPPHSRHDLFWRSCSHICDPPHSRHDLFWRSCSHLRSPAPSAKSLLGWWGHLAALRGTNRAASVGMSADGAAGAECGSVLEGKRAAGVGYKGLATATKIKTFYVTS